MDKHQLWGGRFEKPLDASAFRLGQSIYLDIRLLPYDIQQSAAYINALGEAHLVSFELQQRIAETLGEIAVEFQSGNLKFEPTDEDVHGFLERLLVERVGNDASLIRLGRSRNDQVVTDLKLLLFVESEKLQLQIRELIHTIAERSEELVDVFSTSYTHTQRAQPLIASHELLKHGFALSRNLTRLRDWSNRHSSLPLGSGAGTGSSVSINFEQIAQELGFQEVSFNSLDATSSRDFVTEFLYICSQIALDISRFAEEIILWSTREFGFVTLPDEFSTGSSLMPQKRNPDFAELARGKSSRVVGNLVNVLTLLKALPFGYNRDLQEDKFPVFDSIDTLELVLPAFSGLVRTIEFHRGNIEKSLSAGHILATDIAEWLVTKGMAYRDAHEIVGQLVVLAESNNVDVANLSIEQFNSVSEIFTEEFMAVLSIERSIESRQSPGSANRNNVLRQISKLRSL